MGFNLSGFGTFAGGMSRGIESGVGLVQQYEQIEKGRRRRDAAQSLQELGTYEDFSENNSQAIPLQFQGAEADLTPGAQPLAPTGGAIPDVMTAGGMKRPHFNEFVAAKERAFAPFYEDNPELMFQVRQDLETTRRHMLLHAATQAHSASDEDAARILGDAYDRLLGDDGSEPAEIHVATVPGAEGKDPVRMVKIGDHSMPFDNLAALLRSPEQYDAWLQAEKSREQDADQFGVTTELRERQLGQADTQIANDRAAQEDMARFRMDQLGVERAKAETQADYYAARRAALGAERGEAYSKAVGDGFKAVSAAEPDYRTDLENRDPDFSQRFGHTIGVVADALVEADPSKSGRHYLNTAEWMVRTRDPEAFERLMETDPNIAERWTATLADGTKVPAYEIRPDGGADIKVFTAPIIGEDGEATGQVQFIIDPITGAKQRLTPELRSVFDRLENGNLGPRPATPASPGGDEEPTGIPDSTAGRAGASVGTWVRDEARDWKRAFGEWGDTMALPGEILSPIVSDFTQGLFADPDEVL